MDDGFWSLAMGCMVACMVAVLICAFILVGSTLDMPVHP